MEPKHRLAGSSKKHSGNDPRYMQNDTGPTQALNRFTESIGSNHPSRVVGEKKPAAYPLKGKK
jgi:hypothetical protein